MSVFGKFGEEVVMFQRHTHFQVWVGMSSLEVTKSSEVDTEAGLRRTTVTPCD